jgi:hypothetical protein
VTPENKKYLKDNFNVDADKYSKDTLKAILIMIDKKILISTKKMLEENKALEAQIKYCDSYLDNN